jgi:hypothetical protein
MLFAAAARMESDPAKDLRRAGGLGRFEIMIKIKIERRITSGA